MRISDNLLLYFLYMCFGLTFFPLPTLPLVTHMGRHYDPWLVALIGSTASCIAGLIDYSVLSLAMRPKAIQYVLQKKWFLIYRRFFEKIAFVTLAVTAFIPMTFEPVKLLAILSRYDKRKYIMAVFMGRTPRYFLLATVGSTGKIPMNALIGAFVLLLLASIWEQRVILKDSLAIVYRGCARRLKKIHKQDPCIGGTS